MVKKGKGKAGPSDPTADPSKDASGSKGKKGQKPPPVQEQLPPPGPPKPTVKQIIGGSSWTGKLPVNLLSEHCQKMQWFKPDYNVRKTPEGFSVWITLSAKDPKTQITTTLEPFKIPASHKHLIMRDTALEAKHAAATYALFRVCSMQNKHTVLPPDYKSLWKDFQELKKADVKEGREWQYDADPFKTHREREEAKAKADKKRKELDAAKAKAKEMPGASGLALLNKGGAGGQGNAMKGWTTAPKVEMGKQTRTQLENILRKGISWNPHGIEMSKEQKASVVEQLKKLDFRQSHVAEAVEYCKDREETLEWLLIHVPEDDLPRWALPESYVVGVSIGPTDLRREGIIKRLSQTGYSLELCTRMVDEMGGDEDKAANALQSLLLKSTREEKPEDDADDFLDMGSPEEQWTEEVASIEAMYGENFKRESERLIEIRLEDVKNSGQGKVQASLQIRMAPTYPKDLILAVSANLPSYIKLSVIKKALAYMYDQLADEPLKMFLIVDWIQQNINGIIENPGKLVEISAVSSAASESKPVAAIGRGKKNRAQPRPIKWVKDDRVTEQWLRKQESQAQQKMIAQRERLPAWRVKDEIVRTVQANHVTIISGETGSGKSTQSMQFMLDDLYEKGLGQCANMIVTQPRRISALGLADRVADERCGRVGGEIGYSIRGESKTSKETKVTFVTTGVLLRRLQTSGGRVEDVIASLEDVSHIVIDEVHERSLDTDFLLTLLREVLRARKDMLKLVLMSATLDAKTFMHFFASEGLSVGAVEISGRTFPVEDYYLEDIIRYTSFGADAHEAVLGDESMKRVIQNMGSRINYDLLAKAVDCIDVELDLDNNTGGILIFLPGVAEINQTCRILQGNSSLLVLPLHASLETKEQKRVFNRPPQGKRKVVVATNVAETSITIDDIVAVIDSGKVKEISYDPQNNMRKLEDTWASQAACKQRRGRAGRVQEGKCWKLYTKALEQKSMPERPEPEIRRVPLEQLCLAVRAMGMRDVAAFLKRSPTPPDSSAIEGALKLLRRMGALDGDELTAMGQQLAMLPADLRCGKLMIFGAIFNCLDDCVTIAAILSSRNGSPFFSPPDRRSEANEARMSFFDGHGDLITDLEAYRTWDAMMNDRRPQREVRSFCDAHFLSYNILSDIASHKSQYYSALGEISVVAPNEAGQDSHISTSPRDPRLLRALIAAAFTPQVARIQYPDKKYQNSVSGAVELDPDAKSIKYFNQENGRVFVHPSSTLFGSQSFSGNAMFMSYFSIISTAKIFIRELTRMSSLPCSSLISHL